MNQNPISDEHKLIMISVLIKLGALALGWFLIQRHTAWIQHIFVDIWGWLDFIKKSNEGLIPYVDFSKEYPVGAGLIYWFIAKLVPNSNSTQVLYVHSWIMSVFDVVNVLLFYRILKEVNPKRAFGLSLLMLLVPTALILSPVRFETVVMLFSLLGYHDYRKGRFHLSAFFWSIGCTIKWYPALFILIQEWRLWRKERGYPIPWHGIKSFLILAGVFLAVNLPWIVMGWMKNGHMNAWLNTYLFHVHRPLYWDTPLGAMQLWLGELTWEKYASLWSLILMLGVVLWKPRMSLEAKSVLAMIAALFFNRIYSTQFNLWFYPFLLLGLAKVETRKPFWIILGTLILLDGLNVGVYPFSFTECLKEIGNFIPGIAVTKGEGGTILFTEFIFLRMVILGALFYFVSWMEPGEPELS